MNQIGKRLQLHILFSLTLSNDIGMLTFSKLGISRIELIEIKYFLKLQA